MRILRILFLCLALTAVASVVLLAAALSPWVQTWVLERLLARQPGVQASVGSITVGRSKTRVSDLVLHYDGAVLTLPAAEITLPLWTALRDRKIAVRGIVAKGWTLDLSHRPPRAQKPGEVSPVSSPAGERDPAALAPVESPVAPKVARDLPGVLGGWNLPFATSWDGVEVQGEVLLATGSAREPIRVQVTLRGGGVGAGQQGDLALEALVRVPNPGRWPAAYGAEGRLGVAMSPARTIDRVEFNGRITARGDALPDNLGVSAVVERNRANQETYRVDFTRGDRHLMTVSTQLAGKDARIHGTWTLDLRDSDGAGLLPGRALPGVASRGEGSFDTDVRFGRLRATGRLTSEVARGNGASPSGDRFAGTKLEAGFELSRVGRVLQFDRLDVAVAGAGPVAHVRCVQPFTCDETTGTLAVPEPAADWLAGTLHGLPVAWLSGPVDGVGLSGGDVTGAFTAKLADGVIALRTESPLAAAGVSVQREGRTLARGLDVSVALRAERSSRGWQWHGAPLILSSAGRQLASIEVSVAPPAGGGRTTAIDGTGSADLEAWADVPVLPGWTSLLWRSVAGSFAASVGTATEASATLNLVGHDPGNAVTANVRVHANARGQVAFNAPISIRHGKQVAEISAEGTWTPEREGGQLSLELGAVAADVEPLRWLATSWWAGRGRTGPGSAVVAGNRGQLQSTAERDRQPFWGDWRGRVKFHAYQLRAGERELRQVTGAVAVDRGTLRLEPSRGTYATPMPSLPVPGGPVHRQPKAAEPPSSVVTMEGAVTFEAAADLPYRLEANVGVDGVDAAQMLGTARARSEQCVEGRFAVALTLGSTGKNLSSLVEGRQEEFRLTGKNGILRLLKVNVAEAIPEKPTPVADALSGAGSLLGAVLGLGRNSFDSGVRALPKATEAVLNFSYQVPEVRYDELVITARRNAGAAIQLTGFTMTAPQLRLAGTGRIERNETQPLGQGAMELELKLGVRGNFAELLATAGLLSTEKDAAGYTWLREPLHLGGTLDQIDATRWRDQLLKAAIPAPERARK